MDLQSLLNLPTLISAVGVVSAYLIGHGNQRVTVQKDASDDQSKFRSDILQENRDLRQRLTDAEKRLDGLANDLDLARRETDDMRDKWFECLRQTRVFQTQAQADSNIQSIRIAELSAHLERIEKIYPEIKPAVGW